MQRSQFTQRADFEEITELTTDSTESDEAPGPWTLLFYVFVIVFCFCLLSLKCAFGAPPEALLFLVILPYAFLVVEMPYAY